MIMIIEVTNTETVTKHDEACQDSFWFENRGYHQSLMKDFQMFRKVYIEMKHLLVEPDIREVGVPLKQPYDMGLTCK